MIARNIKSILSIVNHSFVQQRLIKSISYNFKHGSFIISKGSISNLFRQRGPKFTKQACTLITTKYCFEKEVFRERENVNTELKTYIEDHKDKLKDAEERLKECSRIMLSDIKETKEKVKGKVEEIIEHENIYTIPNLLCVTRILITPYLGMLIVQSDFDFALGILAFAALTDFLDGVIARTWVSQASKIGSFLDPLADKLLIATLFLTLTYANLIPIALTGIIIVRDVILVAAAFIIRYKSLPPPKTMSRYFDMTHATAQLAPTFISKVNTAVQLLLVGSTLAAPVFHYVGHPLLESLWYVTGTTTVAAGMSYILSKDTYKYLKRPQLHYYPDAISQLSNTPEPDIKFQ